MFLLDSVNVQNQISDICFTRFDVARVEDMHSF
jgi:hypothetical protein